mmetsp:Transcript_13362/g.22266  ORF Transcript_13362/g.22266 Transcript_13362/m.22266 type:complete len:229 (-) Transcript_13362:26-712(-)
MCDKFPNRMVESSRGDEDGRGVYRPLLLTLSWGVLTSLVFIFIVVSRCREISAVAAVVAVVTWPGCNAAVGGNQAPPPAVGFSGLVGLEGEVFFSLMLTLKLAALTVVESFTSELVDIDARIGMFASDGDTTPTLPPPAAVAAIPVVTDTVAGGIGTPKVNALKSRIIGSPIIEGGMSSGLYSLARSIFNAVSLNKIPSSSRHAEANSMLRNSTNAKHFAVFKYIDKI